LSRSLLRAAKGIELSFFTLCKTISTDTQKVYIYSDGSGKVVIGFDQTEGSLLEMSKDWIKNLKFWKKSLSIDSETYKAHEGFVEEYESVRQEITNFLATIQVKALVIVGFSQGGGTATLCVRDMVHWLPNSIRIIGIAYASPRVYGPLSAMEFESALKKHGNASMKRISWTGDLVTGLAPWVLFYKHVSKEIVIGGRKKFFRLDASVHNIDKYISYIENSGVGELE